MSAWTLSTTRSIAVAAPVSAEPLRENSAWSQTCRPSALALLGLAIAVALWGFGYKLSEYSNAPDPLQRTSVAKVWIEHRYGFASTQHARALPRRTYTDRSRIFDVSSPAVQPIFTVERSTALVSESEPRRIPFFQSAIPLRSPPIPALA